MNNKKVVCVECGRERPAFMMKLLKNGEYLCWDYIECNMEPQRQKIITKLIDNGMTHEEADLWMCETILEFDESPLNLLLDDRDEELINYIDRKRDELNTK